MNTKYEEIAKEMNLKYVVSITTGLISDMINPEYKPVVYVVDKIEEIENDIIEFGSLKRAYNLIHDNVVEKIENGETEIFGINLRDYGIKDIRENWLDAEGWFFMMNDIVSEGMRTLERHVRNNLTDIDNGITTRQIWGLQVKVTSNIYLEQFGIQAIHLPEPEKP